MGVSHFHPQWLEGKGFSKELIAWFRFLMNSGCVVAESEKLNGSLQVRVFILDSRGEPLACVFPSRIIWLGSSGTGPLIIPVPGFMVYLSSGNEFNTEHGLTFPIHDAEFTSMYGGRGILSLVKVNEQAGAEERLIQSLVEQMRLTETVVLLHPSLSKRFSDRFNSAIDRLIELLPGVFVTSRIAEINRGRIWGYPEFPDHIKEAFVKEIQTRNVIFLRVDYIHNIPSSVLIRYRTGFFVFSFESGELEILFVSQNNQLTTTLPFLLETYYPRQSFLELLTEEIVQSGLPPVVPAAELIEKPGRETFRLIRNLIVKKLGMVTWEGDMAWYDRQVEGNPRRISYEGGYLLHNLPDNELLDFEEPSDDEEE